MKLSNSVIAFSQGNPETAPLIEMFCDYWNHYRTEQEGAKGLSYRTTGKNKAGQEISVTFADKEESVSEYFKNTVYKLAGVQNPNILPEMAWASHPLVGWYTFAIVSTLIDAVLPDTLIDTIGMYTDIRNIGWGDSATFEIEPRDLFPVTKAGRGMRQAEIRKAFNGQIALIPENHEMTVGVNLYRVLSGAESLARFTSKAVRSMETQVALDAYTAFHTAMVALPTTSGNANLRVSGYSQDDLVRLAQKVSAWNGGSKAVIVGTQRAMQSVLPDDANYRYDLSSEYVKLGYLKNFFGYDGIVLPQVADWTSNFGVSLNDSTLYIISPAGQKPVKLVLEGNTLSYTNGQFDMATLNQTTTFQKSWVAGIATNAIAATISL
jgi:hypothetical protein